MKANSHEARLLKCAATVVNDFVEGWPNKNHQEARFQLLEAVASRLGGFELAIYQRAFGFEPIADCDNLLAHARTIVEEIEKTTIPPALAVSVLAREGLDMATQKRSGAFHTDFRLAEQLARELNAKFKPGTKIIDPACGAGILLTAVTLAVCGADRQLTSEWLSQSVYAADLSPNALRGSLIALASLTDDVPAIVEMWRNWCVQDSLIAGSEYWKTKTKLGFDIVIANPPWEKIKITRHEFIQAEGIERHYGATYDEFDAGKFSQKKAEVESYGLQLAKRYSTLRSGERDMYVAFAELLLSLAKPGGSVGLLLPAGLIRSRNTRLLREQFFNQSEELAIQILENRSRFFEIDTRFKFLLLRARKNSGKMRCKPIELSHAYGTASGVEVGARIRVGRTLLARLRPDLTVPEVKSAAEWRLFVRIAQGGVDWSKPNSPWHPKFMREVDMTRDRSAFLSKRAARTLALIEGRMVHQYRLGAKSYGGGTGRSSQWRLNQLGSSKVRPQFWIYPHDLSSRAARRVREFRAGFCDITGQTNERSCLSAIIPPGVVCGNKVPTITFPNDPREERIWLWVAIANSLPFDWMLRRVITTTVNYFHLLSIPLPPLEPSSLPGQQLVEIAKSLSDLDCAGTTREMHWQMAELRARADNLVMNAYGLLAADLHLMMDDFPLIDRVQPPIQGELKSTVTRDLVIAHGKQGRDSKRACTRVDIAASQGALPYMPTQMAIANLDDELEEAECV